MKKSLFLILFFCTLTTVFAQNKRDSGLIQFSGILLSADSIFPIPFANISVVNKPYGTYSNLEGYFSFVARKGDSIAFSHVEFKTSYFKIPDTLKDYKYSIVKLLTQDTFYLPGVVVMPMPNRSTFDYEFANRSLANDDLARANFNLELQALKERASTMQGDASEAYKALMYKQMMQTNYAAGQIPTIGLMNPFAWAQFFEAWKRGDYKKKQKTLLVKPNK